MEGSGDFMLFEFHPNIKIVKFIKFCMCVFETKSFFYFLFFVFQQSYTHFRIFSFVFKIENKQSFFHYTY